MRNSPVDFSRWVQENSRTEVAPPPPLYARTRTSSAQSELDDPTCCCCVYPDFRVVDFDSDEDSDPSGKCELSSRQQVVLEYFLLNAPTTPTKGLRPIGVASVATSQHRVIA